MKTTAFVVLTGVSYAVVEAKNAEEAEAEFNIISRGAKVQEVIPRAAAMHYRGVFGEYLGAFIAASSRHPKHQTLASPEAS